uniref:hypothetical protein n=1 Tax=Candidatus Wunengus sp. YC63 TaxID=3367699 RepID=UPI0040276BCD
MLISIMVCGFLIGAICLFFIICAKHDYTKLAPYVIMVNKKGEFLNLNDRQIIKENEYANYIKSNIISNIESKKKQKILIFVHGGLNRFNSALKRAEKLYEEILKDGYYPIFIIWDSSLVSSYLDHLLWIRQGRVYRYWGPITFPLYLFADLGRGVTRAPIVIFHQLSTDMYSTFPKPFPSYKNGEVLYEKLFERYKNGNNNQQEIAISRGGDNRGYINKGIRHLLYWVTFLPKLTISPFIDALGKSAWENMLRRTQTLFRKPSEFDIRDNRKNVNRALDTPPTGAVSQFIDCLNKFVHSDGSTGYEITLIGHSMGTIVLNEIIRKYDDLPYNNIVYMAAACTIGEFEKSVIPYLQTHKSKFYNLCLNPIAEVREINPMYLDIPPRGSLLEWIDNFLSSPQATMDRTLGKWDNIIQSTHIIPEDIRGQVNIKAFIAGPANGNEYQEGNPQKHADFTGQEFWKEAFWTPKAQTSE